MSFFDSQSVSWTLLQDEPVEGNGDQDTAPVDDVFEENVLALRNFSLIFTSADGSPFEMHHLVQLATRAWPEANGQLEYRNMVFIDTLWHEFPNIDFKNWATFQALFRIYQSPLRACQKAGRTFYECRSASLVNTPCWVWENSKIDCEN